MLVNEGELNIIPTSFKLKYSKISLYFPILSGLIYPDFSSWSSGKYISTT